MLQKSVLTNETVGLERRLFDRGIHSFASGHLEKPDREFSRARERRSFSLFCFLLLRCLVVLGVFRQDARRESEIESTFLFLDELEEITFVTGTLHERLGALDDSLTKRAGNRPADATASLTTVQTLRIGGCRGRTDTHLADVSSASFAPTPKILPAVGSRLHRNLRLPLILSP